MPITIGQGSVTATLDNGLEELLRRAIDHTVPGLVNRVEATAQGIYRGAFDRWPVRTGRSRAALAWEVRLAPDLSSIRARVSNSAPYAKYVPVRSLGGKNAFVELLRKPTLAAGREIALEVAEVVERTLGGG